MGKGGITQTDRPRVRKIRVINATARKPKKSGIGLCNCGAIISANKTQCAKCAGILA